MSLSELASFCEKLREKFSAPGNTASPEDQLKTPICSYVEEIGKSQGLSLITNTESTVKELKVRPDIAIYQGGLILGYIELKAPGKGADPKKLKSDHDKTQWKKLQNLPNLIYCDGIEWALYRSGERVGPLVRLADSPLDAGADASDENSARKIEDILTDFFRWKPNVPHKTAQLAEYLAPLTKVLRDGVADALLDEGSAISLLASEWRQYFFPEANDAQFADAYAQTVTYALLLARLSGADDLDPNKAAEVLDANNGVLATALKQLGQKDARAEVELGFSLLQRSLSALDRHDVLKSDPEIWLYFYEDFLAAYDDKLRKEYGVYYTPKEVVELQVQLISEVLQSEFGKPQSFADDGVTFLDPAVGTGTYLVSAVKHGLKAVEQRYGAGQVPSRAMQMAQNMYGFEVLVGPYAVAHLRLTQMLRDVGADQAGGLGIFLADTLESPNAEEKAGTLTYRKISEEHTAARKVKNEGQVLVCLGNPPYHRQQLEAGDTQTRRKGGWVRFGDEGQDEYQMEEGAEARCQRPILQDFIDPTSAAGAGGHLKNIYNDYVYFWRWALWRLFEKQDEGGIVSFITASSFLAGPGFVGMRQVMRQTFDRLWLIDLGGDNLGARKTPNVFSIQTPVVIAMGMRGPTPQPDKPAQVFYTRIDAQTRQGKLDILATKSGLPDFDWAECSTDWGAPFSPEGQGAFFQWPRLTHMFPWQHSGAQFKRSWPIGETKSILKERLNRLASASSVEKPALFKETRDRHVKWQSKKNPRTSILKATADELSGAIVPYAYRSFDLHYAIIDARLGDFLRPELIGTHGKRQIYFSAFGTKVLGAGYAMTASAHIPDLDVFCGRGGKDVLPLYRDPDGKEPNICTGLLEHISGVFGRNIGEVEFAAYVYAILCNQSYAKRFWNELEQPGTRIPLTQSVELFDEAMILGRELIWLHTYGERFGEEYGTQIPAGTAKCLKAVSTAAGEYPEKFDYDPDTGTLTLGDGEFGPVARDVYEFEVSGLKVVHSWLAYRMKKRAGKKSSPLDDIRPERWTASLTEQFLNLLWVLERSLAMEPAAADLLNRIVAGPLFLEADLPEPTDAQRLPPKDNPSSHEQSELPLQ